MTAEAAPRASARSAAMRAGACASGARRPSASAPAAQRARRHRPSRRPSAPAELGGRAGRPAPAPVGAAGPVRRLLRRGRPGLLRGRGPRRHALAAARTSLRSTVGSAPDGPEFTIGWVPKVLEAREARLRPRDIAQIFQRSGTLSVPWKDSEHHEPARLRGQEGRRLGLRQRVRGHRRRSRTGPGSSSGDPTTTEGHPELRHGRAALEPRDRCRRGDDLQRVRPGPRGEEPGDRRAVQARRPQRHQLERRRRRRCSRTRSSPARRGSPRPATTTSPSASCGPRSRAGSTAATTRTTASSTPSTPGSQLGAGHQRWLMNEVNAAHLAVAGRHRHDRHGPLGADRRRRAERGRHQGRPAGRRLPDRPRRGGARGITGDTKGADFVKGTVEVTRAATEPAPSLHRSAARAGPRGPAVRFAAPRAAPKAERIVRVARLRLDWGRHPPTIEDDRGRVPRGRPCTAGSPASLWPPPAPPLAPPRRWPGRRRSRDARPPPRRSVRTPVARPGPPRRLAARASPRSSACRSADRQPASYATDVLRGGYERQVDSRTCTAASTAMMMNFLAGQRPEPEPVEILALGPAARRPERLPTQRGSDPLGWSRAATYFSQYTARPTTYAGRPTATAAEALHRAAPPDRPVTASRSDCSSSTAARRRDDRLHLDRNPLDGSSRSPASGSAIRSAFVERVLPPQFAAQPLPPDRRDRATTSLVREEHDHRPAG